MMFRDLKANLKAWAPAYVITVIMGALFFFVVWALEQEERLPFSLWIGFSIVGIASIIFGFMMKFLMRSQDDENADGLTRSFLIAHALCVLAAALITAFMLNDILPLPTVFGIALALFVGLGVTYAVEAFFKRSKSSQNPQ